MKFKFADRQKVRWTYYGVLAEFEEKWHVVFCLRPRRIAPRDVRWLEWIERRKVYATAHLPSHWEYRALQDQHYGFWRWREQRDAFKRRLANKIRMELDD